MFRNSLIRSSISARAALVRPANVQAARRVVGVEQLQKRQSSHAVSSPTLADIEKRWDGMPPQEQAELWMELRDRMKNEWTKLTLQEKKAGLSPSSFRYVCTAIAPSIALQSLPLLKFTYWPNLNPLPR